MPNKKIYINTIAQITGKLITAVISIFLIKILTGYLDVAGYGLYSKIYNYLSIFAVIADLGLYTITVRELSKYQDDEKMVSKISGNILSLRTLSGIIIIFLSLAIAPFLTGYNSHMALMGICITSLFTLTGLMNSSLMSYLQSILKTEFSLIANTCGKLTTFILIAISAYVVMPRGEHGDEEIFIMVMLAGLIGNIIMLSLTWWHTSKYHRITFEWDTEYIKHILRISLPYGLALFLGVIFFKVDIILLSVMEDHAIADTSIALYALPMKIVEVGMMYGTIFLNSLLPVLTRAIEEKDHKKTKSLTGKGFELLFGFGLAIAIFGYVYATEITRLISTTDFISTTILGYSSVDAMQIVIWIFLFYFVSSLSSYILIAKGEQSKMMWINAIVAIINIIGNLIIIPYYSFVGSAWVTLGTQILLMSITWYYVRDTIEIKKSTLYVVMMSLLGGFAIFLSIQGVQFISLDITNSLSMLYRLAIGGIVFSGIYLTGWWIIRKKV